MILFANNFTVQPRTVTNRLIIGAIREILQHLNANTSTQSLERIGGVAQASITRKAKTQQKNNSEQNDM